METLDFLSIIYQVVPRLPGMIVVAGALIYSFIKMPGNKPKGYLAIAGLGIMLLTDIFGTIMSIGMTTALRNGMDTKTYANIWMVYSIFGSLLFIVSLILIVLAIWKKDKQQNVSEFPPQPDAYQNRY